MYFPLSYLPILVASQRVEIKIQSARLKNEILSVCIYPFDQKAWIYGRDYVTSHQMATLLQKFKRVCEINCLKMDVYEK